VKEKTDMTWSRGREKVALQVEPALAGSVPVADVIRVKKFGRIF
jgi:hypothetical protein